MNVRTFIFILFGIILTEAAWIIFSKPASNPLDSNKEKQLKDSIRIGQAKFDSLNKVITIKDHQYDSLQEIKSAVEYRTKERIVYINTSNADSLDKFIRSNW